MKARRKSDGKIIEVTERQSWNKEVIYVCNGTFYRTSELDPLPEKETDVLEGWAARDECGSLFCFNVLPSREFNYWRVPIHAETIALPANMLPSVTWESEPKRIRIKIEEIEG